MGRELYVGNISFEVTEEDLFKLFSVVGPVRAIHLIKDAKTGQFKGCGYVKMVNAADVKAAITTLDGALLGNRQITVSVANPPKPPAGKPARRPRKPAPESRPKGSPRK